MPCSTCTTSNVGWSRHRQARPRRRRQSELTLIPGQRKEVERVVRGDEAPRPAALAEMSSRSWPSIGTSGPPCSVETTAQVSLPPPPRVRRGWRSRHRRPARSAGCCTAAIRASGIAHQRPHLDISLRKKSIHHETTQFAGRPDHDDELVVHVKACRPPSGRQCSTAGRFVRLSIVPNDPCSSLRWFQKAVSQRRRACRALPSRACPSASATWKNQLGVRLLERTTRRLRPTEAGRRYFERCRAIVSQIDDANREAQQQQREPSGLLRLSAPTLYGRRYLAPVLAAISRPLPARADRAGPG